MENKLTQNQMDHITNLMDRGELTAAQANVKKVRMARFEIIRGSLFREVRKALNQAVKSGELGHYRKTDTNPEVYFHPEFEYLAKQACREHQANKIKALSIVLV